jgi:hypothetical protein
MKMLAKIVKTPIGILPAPLNPNFIKKLEKCKNKYDLFKIVVTNGYICPDAFNELETRNLILEWQKYNNESIRNRVLLRQDF